MDVQRLQDVYFVQLFYSALIGGGGRILRMQTVYISHGIQERIAVPIYMQAWDTKD